jgi:large subunit ribosomal protein L17
MHHRKRTKKLGRSPSHRRALLAALVCSLIDEKRITTTLAKAKMLKPVAEKMITLGRKGFDETKSKKELRFARQRAAGILGRNNSVKTLFDEIVPQFAGRAGGYTRVVKLGRRVGDSAEMAMVEFVGLKSVVAEVEKTEPAS